MLTTERLILRAARQDDLLDLHAIFRDPMAMRYWSTPPHDSPERTQENLDRMMAATDPLLYFVIEMDGTVVGTAGGHGEGEVGFILHPDYWRRGIVQEAMRAILPHIWNATSLERVFADVDPNNTASTGLLMALGFHETHRAPNTYCINGVWSDSVYFALDRPTS
ncbi:MAG: GNAT family N-acetyltransferase [Yoonia sp.]|uniref:GNAT family N-acetyltransferase n=1 Tax=Yoonia sp. TaxID=2212373 RepID=UPI003266EF37